MYHRSYVTAPVGIVAGAYVPLGSALAVTEITPAAEIAIPPATITPVVTSAAATTSFSAVPVNPSADGRITSSPRISPSPALIESVDASDAAVAVILVIRFHVVFDTYVFDVPVAVMRTRAELSLRKTRTADEYREALTQIHTDLEKTSGLVEKLMLLARADYGAEALQLSTANLGDIVRDACSQGRTLSETKQISFHEQIPDFPVWVEADAHALRRLFLILIDNAVKFTRAGGRIEVIVDKQDGSALGVVRDTGIGIAAEDLPNVFERFYRADKARSRESGGVGLGLSIGRWIAEAHAGTIEVQSSLGHGSAFQVRLPLAHGNS